MSKSRLTEDCLRTRSNGCGLDMWICCVIKEEPKLDYLVESDKSCGNEWVEWAEMWASDMTPVEALKEYQRVYIGTPYIQEYIAPENNTGYEPIFDDK